LRRGAFGVQQRCRPVRYEDEAAQFASNSCPSSRLPGYPDTGIPGEEVIHSVRPTTSERAAPQARPSRGEYDRHGPCHQDGSGAT
jgi:hypothetical protein